MALLLQTTCLLNRTRAVRPLFSGRRLHTIFKSYLIAPEKLHHALEEETAGPAQSRIVPVSAAWFMPNDPHGRTGRQSFDNARIPGSLFFDLDEIRDADSPYPHMLPKPRQFAAAMSEMGIKRDDTVVVYDTPELGIFSAPRVAWTFRVFGHPRVHVLNNFKLWTEQDLPIEGKITGNSDTGGIDPRSNYPEPKLDNRLVATYEEMKDIVQQLVNGKSDALILDARSKGRWDGSLKEPRPGLSSGHMPTSVSLPFTDLLDANFMTFHSTQKLREILSNVGLGQAKTFINTCGTGVTAAVLDAAMVETGVGESIRVYDGSWT